MTTSLCSGSGARRCWSISPASTSQPGLATGSGKLASDSGSENDSVENFRTRELWNRVRSFSDADRAQTPRRLEDATPTALPTLTSLPTRGNDDAGALLPLRASVAADAVARGASKMIYIRPGRWSILPLGTPAAETETAPGRETNPAQTVSDLETVVTEEKLSTAAATEPLS